MSTRRTWAAGPLLLLAGLVLGLVLGGPAGAGEAGPAYPPGAGADDVVEADGGPGGRDPAGPGEPATGDRPDDADDGATDGSDDGGDDPAGDDGATAGSDEDGSGGSDGATDGSEDEGTGAEGGDAATDASDDEVAGDATAQEGAPEADDPRIVPLLVVVGTAILLGGAVVAIARRI